MGKKALVTGGCGFIGSNLVHELVNQGWLIDVVDDMSNGKYEFLDGLKTKNVLGGLLQYTKDWESNVRTCDTVLVVEADIENEYILNRIASGYYDVVFHLAANPRVSYTVEHPAITTDINCTRTLSLLEAVQLCKTHVRFVFSSTCAVYGDAKTLPTNETEPREPMSPYGLQKLFVEDYIKMAVKLHHIDAISLRYFNVYGPRQLGDSAYATAITAWCNRIKDGLPLRSDGDGEQSRDLVYVADIVNANILAGSRKEKFSGETINIGSGNKHSNNRILKMFYDKFGELETICAPARAGDVKHTLADITQAQKLLGYNPQTSFEDGLQKTWKWWGF